MFVKWNRAISILAVLTLIVGISMTTIGCGNQSSDTNGSVNETTTQEITFSGVIREAGSTSVLPLAEKWALAFMEKHPNLEITYTGGGSSAGVKQSAAGTVDIGAASREIKITENDLIPIPVARDGVAVIVNENNPIQGLTLEQITKIYTGEIVNWSEVGGNDLQITVYGREEGSGTRDCFDSVVLKKLEVSPTALAKKSNGEVQIGIQEDASGIGYVSLGYINGVKPLLVNDVECTIETCQQGTYPIVRRLYFITQTIPSDAVNAFLNFCRGEEGQKIVADNGFVPLVY
ncbi:MAG TPA: phosphate ABC transporter substrate-binding protein [Caldisericia bacterium]|nr:phosphate ABC transporter substrate-binding protein [Caldisericia bacterium]